MLLIRTLTPNPLAPDLKMKFVRRVLIFILSIIALTANGQAKETSNKILVMEIKAEINPAMNRYVKLALQKARDLQAKAVVIEMNTYGGALNDADEIRTAILEMPQPVIVYINKNAASAGALISLACDSIYMAGGASMGAATVVSGEGVPAPGKYQSYMRSLMRATAEANGRNPSLAEAMVDEDLATDSLNQAGKVLTLTTEEAIKHGYCEAKVKGLDEAINLAGLSSYQRETFRLSATEQIIAFFLNPLISGILIILIIGGIYFEFQHPGTLFPIAVALIALILYFVPYYLNGLAENWEILLFVGGLVLLALEIFVIPGFGLPGISGLVLILSSLVLATLDNKIFDFSLIEPGKIVNSILTMVAGFAGGLILIIFGGWRLSKTKFFNRIALPDVMDKNAGFTSTLNAQSLVGIQGETYTVLRPSGKVMIGDKLYDAYSRGEYIEKGVTVEVISVEGTSVRVKGIAQEIL